MCDASNASLVDLGGHVSACAEARLGPGSHHTISADSGPAILNSISAYFFQYPNSSGNLSRKRSNASRKVASAWGLEFLFRPPSSDSQALIKLSQCSKLSG